MKLRQELYARRAKLSETDIETKSKCICDALQSFIEPRMFVASYSALAHEVQLKSLQKQWQDICIWGLPISGPHGQMQFYQVDSSTTYTQGRYGIQEPVQATLLMPDQFDLVIVPMVGFDEAKHRIGHGAGYYDRWLKETKAFKIGVAFETQKVAHIDVFPHDVDMDMIITECYIYE